MAIATRFRHLLTIRRFVATGAINARGNRPAAWVDDPPLRGNLQERTAREIPTGEIAGVALSDAIAFLPTGIALRTPDRIVKDGLVYEVLGLPRDAGGRGRHLEVDLRRVGS